MAETIEVYGRVGGKLRFRYGPKSFYADWSGAFTALEIANLINKIPAVVKGNLLARAAKLVAKDTPKTRAKRAGAVAEKVNLHMWLERLELSFLLLGVDHMMISAKDEKLLWVDKVIPSQLIVFSGRRPSQLVADALLRMGLNKWGIIKELTLALDQFDDKGSTGNGKCSVSVFIRI